MFFIGCVLTKDNFSFDVAEVFGLVRALGEVKTPIDLSIPF